MAGLSPRPRKRSTSREQLGVPLHPSYTPRFDRLSPAELLELRSIMSQSGRDIEVNITSHHIEEALQHLLVPYTRNKDTATVSDEWAAVLGALMGRRQSRRRRGRLPLESGRSLGAGAPPLGNKGGEADHRDRRDEGGQAREGDAQAHEATGPRPLPGRRSRRQREGPARSGQSTGA